MRTRFKPKLPFTAHIQMNNRLSIVTAIYCPYIVFVVAVESRVVESMLCATNGEITVEEDDAVKSLVPNGSDRGGRSDVIRGVVKEEEESINMNRGKFKTTLIACPKLHYYYGVSAW